MEQETSTVMYTKKRGAKVARVKIRWNQKEQQWQMRGFGPIHGNNKFSKDCDKASKLVSRLNDRPKAARLPYAFRDPVGSVPIHFSV